MDLREADYRRQRLWRADGSFEEMSTGVGPVLLYAAQFGKVGFAAEAKWLPQIGTQNTLKGDFVWFKIGAQF